MLSVRLRAGLLVASLCAAFGASLGAQRLLRGAGQHGLALSGCAFVLAIVAGRLSLPMPPPVPREVPSLRALRPGWLVLGVAALALVVALERLGRAPLVQLAALLLSLCAWLAAYLPRELGLRSEPHCVLITRIALLAASLLSCTYALGHVPGGLYGDESVLGGVVRAHLDGTRPAPLFAVGWVGTWMHAASVTLAGEDIRGLRLAAAIGGALSVLPWFGMLRRELGVVAAAGSALLLCSSPAHQHISRLAQQEAWIGVCAFSALSALYAGLLTGRAVDYVVSGIALGCTFYMGNKAVLLPPILLGAALFGLAATPSGALCQWRGAVLLAAAAGLTFLPQFLAFTNQDLRESIVGHPQRWIAMPHASGPLAHAARVTRLLLDGMEHSPFSPFRATFRIVTEVEGALMVIGLGLCVARPRRPIAAFLLGWLAAGLGSLWLDAQPDQVHHVLLVSCLPAAFAALVLHAWQQGVAGCTSRPALGRWVALACALPLVVANGSAYFGRGDGAAPWAMEEFTALGRAMQEHRDTHHVALVTPPMSWDQNSTLLYLAPGFVAPTKLTRLDPRKPWFGQLERDVVFLVMARASALLPAIRARYPSAPVELRKSAAGDLLLAVVRVPVSEVRRVEAPLRTGPSDQLPGTAASDAVPQLPARQ